MVNCKIAVLGDFNPAYATHHALNDSIRQSVDHLDASIQCDWIGTDVFDTKVVFGKGLYSGLWVAPGSPYKDFENVLDVIHYTRRNAIPTFGNCGGFQHMVIEFARNVCGIREADHAETNPDTESDVIHKLSCSLVGQEETLEILDKDSILYEIVQSDRFKGRYFCSYGLNPTYREALESNGLVFTSQTPDGEARSFEIKSHPFFVGTLFQPALTSSVERPDHLIVEFFRECEAVTNS